jgi:hypothetical protein
MLHSLSPALLITFSLRQGDPLAMLLFVIHIQPLLVRLQRVMAGLSIGVIRETALGYVDDVAALSSTLDDTAKGLYSAFSTTFPPPKIETKLPQFDWPTSWSLLHLPGLPYTAVDTAFSMLHNILPLEVRRHRFGMVPSPECPHCPGQVEDVIHFFTACSRILATWSRLVAAAGRALGGPLPDDQLLYLHLPPGLRQPAVVLAVVMFVDMAWTHRSLLAPLNENKLLAAVAAAAATARPPVHCKHDMNYRVPDFYLHRPR